ncbi:hypothetical protein Q6284_31985, partial [Klebsiella pneumoniae]|nr:hypothetical protein [Klebsiella pneumoniae]
MGSNNRLHGKVMALENGRARIEGASWSLWGRAGEGVSVGEPATAVIRVERLRLDGAAQDNSLQLPLLTSMYLGDRWEYRISSPSWGLTASTIKTSRSK